MSNKFYNTIREYYDYIFPLNKNQVDFVRGELPDADSTLIEIGCANGKLTNALKDYNIMGIDLEESFVAIAKRRYPDVEFKAQNMLELSSLGMKYDGIICFGNTLVHLSVEEIGEFINKCYSCLNIGGKLLIQILNYDNIIDNNITALPIIDNEYIRFERRYRFGDMLAFDTALTIKETSETISNSITLTPIRKDELINVLSEAEFTDINIYGAFGKADLTDKSLPLIVSCIHR